MEDEDSESDTDHRKECLTLSEVQAIVSQYNNKKFPASDGVTNEMLTHVGNSAI